MSTSREVVIIGGVACGCKAAARARRLDPEADVTIVEQGSVLSYAGCGLPYYIQGKIGELRDLTSTPVGVPRNPNFFRTVKGIRALLNTRATQLIILSGKGGTGKTSVAAAFAHLAAKGESALRAVLADADVDAANLELVLAPQTVETHEFIGGAVAEIDPAKCQGCGTCYDVCRFDAVRLPLPNSGKQEGESQAHTINPIACEGCAACAYQCPEEAIHMAPQLAGHWFRSESRYGPLFHAALRPAQENSGKLVTLVKQQARLLALDEGYAAVLVDGPPGIGCPVISAVSGADLALIVAEPTAAGIHDMERVLATTAHFRVPALVCINKADIYPEGAGQIEAYCHDHDVEVVGRIPFDATVTEAMVQGQPVTAFDQDAPASRALATVWQCLAARINGGAV